MDAKARIRAYLEQRREFGETEFVLDQISLEEALQAIGAIRTSPPRRKTIPSPPPEKEIQPEVSSAPEKVNASPPLRVEKPVEKKIMARPKARPVTATRNDDTKLEQGLVVGSSTADMFETNPFAHLKTIGAIAKEVAQCTRCDLYKTATNPVPGEGNLKAEVMCVGEAPGANEDATGRPFVGAGGKLLDKILAAINLSREEVFICNVLKHRPPGNRNPHPDEVTACKPYLLRQIEIIRPKVIIAWGTFAAQTLLETKTPIGKLRGMVHSYHDVPLVVTYHPAALLRNPAWKRPTWEDVQLARRVLDAAS